MRKKETVIQKKRNVAFGSKMRTIREEFGLSLLWLSGETGLDVANLSRIENGRGNPTLSSISDILDALWITFPGFFTYHIS